jgi:hypothetical protein
MFYKEYIFKIRQTGINVVQFNKTQKIRRYNKTLEQTEIDYYEVTSAVPKQQL